MVHALEEVRRVLIPGGILLDIRPLTDHWRIEVVSARGVKETGRVEDLPAQVNADAASNSAMMEVEALGWFKREREEFFPFFYSWDTPSEMEETIKEEWEDSVGVLTQEAKQATRTTWALSDADSRIRVDVKILISKWRKTSDAVEP